MEAPLTVCPFCKSRVPHNAVVCGGCGAAKGTRGNAASAAAVFGRFLIWAHTIGLALVVSGGLAVTCFANGRPILAIVVGSVGFVITKVLVTLWKSIFGTLSDPMWRRRM